MGAVHGLLAYAGLTGPAACGSGSPYLWAGDVVHYHSLGMDEFLWRWSGCDNATDLAHKSVYAAVIGVVLTTRAKR
jgi:hypothetical protein